MTDFIYEEAFEPDVNIKVIGVGGGGGNALNCMVDSDVSDIEYVTINTDAKALKNSKAATRIQIGAKLTKGRGAGNMPEIGQRSAEENIEEIEAALKGADMVFITAGMGGGTGTGAAPVVAKTAQQMGILTVAVVTKPFAFEREQKMRQAEAGITELKKYVDSLIVIPNERLLVGLEKSPTMKESFALSDDILKTGVKSISDLIVEEGYINLDFADVATTMKGAGYAHMAVGHGSGKDKAQEAAKSVISSPLLETSIAGAKRLLINVAMSEDTLASDVDTASKMITEAASPDVQFIFGAAFKEDMQDEMKVTVIAADFSDDEIDDNSEDVYIPMEKSVTKSSSKSVKTPKAPRRELTPVVQEDEEDDEDEDIIPIDNPLVEENKREYQAPPVSQQPRRPSVNDMDMQEIFDILGGN
ncbi:MAG: cell division protein FtsZ [Oscillospiraceae bacterium]|nr:cell division protein FtsZ [Oscillospiraceae bacterium]